MHNEITVERSLLYIQQHQVEQYKTLANQMKEFDSIIISGGLNVTDAWIIAFNVWLQFLPEKDHIIHSAEKTLYYPANFLLLNALLKCSSFQQLKRNQHSPEVIYIASLTITNGINQWIYTVMEKYNLMDLYARNKERIYFDSHLGNSEEINNLAETQARFVKASVIELQTDSFHHMIRNCCDEALQIHEKYTQGVNK